MHHFDKIFLIRLQRNTDMYVHISTVGTKEGGGVMGQDMADRLPLTLIQSWRQIMGTTWYSPNQILRSPYGSAYALLYLAVLCLA